MSRRRAGFCMMAVVKTLGTLLSTSIDPGLRTINERRLRSVDRKGQLGQVFVDRGGQDRGDLLVIMLVPLESHAQACTDQDSG